MTKKGDISSSVSLMMERSTSLTFEVSTKHTTTGNQACPNKAHSCCAHGVIPRKTMISSNDELSLAEKLNRKVTPVS